MSKRDVRLFLSDILEAIGKVERYIAGLSFDEFQANEMVIDAVTRNLEVIGEAVKRIPQELRAKYPAIEKLSGRLPPGNWWNSKRSLLKCSRIWKVKGKLYDQQESWLGPVKEGQKRLPYLLCINRA